MENGLKGLLIAAGVIITCVVIGIGFYVSRESTNTSNDASGQIVGMTSQYQSIDSNLYDGKNVSGLEVVDLIKKKVEWLEIIVVNGNGNTVTYNYKIAADGTMSAVTDVDIATAQANPSGLSYVKPTGAFLGTVKKNNNGVIVSITFKQQ